ncbi:hypothetical protein BXZ70DRAFT_39146 [Cristinia sonorae]|uniref:NYN domain-containing protein n=1 Tax=Cristinia sonorae TaxID=1940300 RepID=A0A8K0XVG0_9AGAR|nr:hypothetical protein BXZ70DRAFT_39146 [Cristinia sonorae]
MPLHSTDAVHIFWDFKFCGPPSYADTAAAVQGLKTIAHQHGAIKTFIAYLEVPNLPSNTTYRKSGLIRACAAMTISGVNVRFVPDNFGKSAHEKEIMVQIMSVTMIEIPSPSTIVLVSSDRHLRRLVSTLVGRGYKVLVFTPPDLHDGMQSLATGLFKWWDDVLPASVLEKIKKEKSRVLKVPSSEPGAGSSSGTTSNPLGARAVNSRTPDPVNYQWDTHPDKAVAGSGREKGAGRGKGNGKGKGKAKGPSLTGGVRSDSGSGSVLPGHQSILSPEIAPNHLNDVADPDLSPPLLGPTQSSMPSPSPFIPRMASFPDLTGVSAYPGRMTSTEDVADSRAPSPHNAHPSDSHGEEAESSATCVMCLAEEWQSGTITEPASPSQSNAEWVDVVAPGSLDIGLPPLVTLSDPQGNQSTTIQPEPSIAPTPSLPPTVSIPPPTTALVASTPAAIVGTETVKMQCLRPPPEKFKTLVKVLEGRRMAGASRVITSQLGKMLNAVSSRAYKEAGCSKLKDYLAIADEEGVIFSSTDDQLENGNRWVSLHPVYHGYVDPTEVDGGC